MISYKYIILIGILEMRKRITLDIEILLYYNEDIIKIYVKVMRKT